MTSLGQIAYDGYYEALRDPAAGVDPLLDWEHRSQRVKTAWEAAAVAVVHEMQERKASKEVRG